MARSSSSTRLFRVNLQKRANSEDPNFALFKFVPLKVNTLDVDIIGTESTTIYSLKVKSDELSKIRAKECRDNDLLMAVLNWVFLHEQTSAAHKATIDALYQEASLDGPGNILTLIIGQKISGITQRIAELNLIVDENANEDLFDWAGEQAIAIQSADDELIKLQKDLGAERAKTEKLENQLNQFIMMKKRQEDEMLEKFRQLLNTKKLKIRDQQRLLATAKVDPSLVADVQAERQSTRLNGVKAGKDKGKRLIKEEESEDERMADDATAFGSEDERIVSPQRSETDEGEQDNPTRPRPASPNSSKATLPHKAASQRTIFAAGVDDESTDDDL